MDFDSLKQVIVLAGGPSPEAVVSRVSGRGVAEALEMLGVAHEVWELSADWQARVKALSPDTFVFIALHGCPGEDGTVQAVLEEAGLPYNGSGVVASQLAIDKVRTCAVLKEVGLDIPAALSGEALADNLAVEAFLQAHGKMVVKPVCGGSSLGLTVVEDMAAWPVAHALAAVQGAVMMEEYIPGRELAVGVLGEEPLPVVEIIPKLAEIYDYASKYEAGGSVHTCPADLPEEITAQAQQGAVKAAGAVAARGACRVDFRYDETTGRLVALEVNTLPGLTPTSLLPDAARYAGVAHQAMDYSALVRWMIEDGLKRQD